jgi:hypothetical protein
VTSKIRDVCKTVSSQVSFIVFIIILFIFYEHTVNIFNYIKRITVRQLTFHSNWFNLSRSSYKNLIYIILKSLWFLEDYFADESGSRYYSATTRRCLGTQLNEHWYTGVLLSLRLLPCHTKSYCHIRFHYCIPHNFRLLIILNVIFEWRCIIVSQWRRSLRHHWKATTCYFNMFPILLCQWEIQTHSTFFFRKVACTRHYVPLLVKHMNFI